MQRLFYAFMIYSVDIFARNATRVKGVKLLLQNLRISQLCLTMETCSPEAPDEAIHEPQELADFTKRVRA